MKLPFEREHYPTGDGVVLLLPSAKLIARRIELSRDVPVREQVELAVESYSPLPLTQLFWGFLPSADHRHALVWIACRKHFPPEETQAWPAAAAVLPAQLLLCRRKATEPGTVLHRDRSSVTAAVWDERSSVPAALVTRVCTPDDQAEVEAQVMGEVQRRTGAGPSARTQATGQVETVRQPKGLYFRAEGTDATYTWEELTSADLRDREELATTRRRLRHAGWAWRSTAAAALLLLIAGIADGAVLLGGLWLRRHEQEVRQRSARVSEIEATHTLAHRLHELSGRRFQLMEMIDLLNEKRPPGLRFVRAVSEGSRTLDLNIETQNADEARQYEEGLRSLPELRSVRLSDMETRQGSTRFLLRAEFKSDPTPTGGAMP